MLKSVLHVNGDNGSCADQRNVRRYKLCAKRAQVARLVARLAARLAAILVARFVARLVARLVAKLSAKIGGKD